MKRSELKQLMKEIYQRKLAEIGDRMGGVVPPSGNSNDRFSVPAEKSPTKGGAKYGYVAGEHNGEPLVQIVGYGKMTLKQLKNSAVDEISKLIKAVRDENYGAARHVIEMEGMLDLFLNALVEIGEKGKLKEAVPTPAPAATAAAVAPIGGAPQLSAADQQKIMKIEQDKAKATADMENTKGKLAKITRPFTDKINKYEKQIADLNTAAERIKR